jgi:hypothetical protein
VSPYFVWPDEVYVLTDAFLQGDAGCDNDNYPRQPMLWFQLEVRLLPCSFGGQIFLIDLLVDRFVAILAELKRRKFKYAKCDLYNATWASFGYVHNQCPKAIRISQFKKWDN